MSRSKCYDTLPGDCSSRPLRLAVAVVERSVCGSDEWEGDSLPSGKVVEPIAFFVCLNDTVNSVVLWPRLLCYFGAV